MPRRIQSCARFTRALTALLLACVAHASAAETAADIDFPNPFNWAQKGQWVVYRVADRAEQRTTVSDIAANGDITIVVEQKNGESYDFLYEATVTAEDVRYPKKKLRSSMVITDIAVENREARVAGKVEPVVIVRYITGKNSRNAMHHTMTLLTEVPIYGEVLVETDILPYPATELVAFGGPGVSEKHHDAETLSKEADRFFRMRTHHSIKAAIFLWKEVIRRFPKSPEAEEAAERMPEAEKVLGQLPREPKKQTEFNWTQGDELAWLVPKNSEELKTGHIELDGSK